MDGKVMEFKRLQAVFSDSCRFFQIKILKLIKLILFMQQMQYDAPNLIYI